jgi:hypothetical protein
MLQRDLRRHLEFAKRFVIETVLGGFLYAYGPTKALQDPGMATFWASLYYSVLTFLVASKSRRCNSVSGRRVVYTSQLIAKHDLTDS